MRKHTFFLVTLLMQIPALPSLASEAGKEGFKALKHCVMNNDVTLCHKAITPDSYAIADRFIYYKLMPCLPTNFTYAGENSAGGYTIVKATMPAPDNRHHTLRLAFANTQLDIPESLRIGLGENWQDKLNLAEQLFLMMRNNAGNQFTCDQLSGVLRR